MEFLDYQTLKLIWWALIGVLMVGFTVTDGFDMGVGTLLLIIGKSNDDRRVMINSMAPHWEGNQVWLVTAGGAMFAAWPQVYATAFSGFYFAILLTLAALFFRPVGFDYRGKIDDPRWRRLWDIGLFAGGAIPPIIFGVAFGNLLQGVPIVFDEYLRLEYQGTFFGLLNPFGLLAGVLCLVMVLTQGATWLLMKTDGELEARSRKTAIICGVLTTVLFAIGGFWVAKMDGYVILNNSLNGTGQSNPLTKEVGIQAGAWLNNYSAYPWMIAAPVLGLAMPLLTAVLAVAKRAGLAFVTSSLAIAGVICTAGFSMFPFIMPSSVAGHLSSSLTALDSTSSQNTLTMMLCAAIIFVPIVLAYTCWTYYKMFGRISHKYISDNSHSLY